MYYGVKLLEFIRFSDNKPKLHILPSATYLKKELSWNVSTLSLDTPLLIVYQINLKTINILT